MAVMGGVRDCKGLWQGAETPAPPVPPHQALGDHREAEEQVFQRHTVVAEQTRRRAAEPQPAELVWRVGDDWAGGQPAIHQHLEERDDLERDPVPPIAEQPGPKEHLKPNVMPRAMKQKSV
jgi:hypothetical protein